MAPRSRPTARAQAEFSDESAIIGNATGVNVQNGAGVFSYQNNEIIFNGVNCAVNGGPTACSTALTSTAGQ